jgi:hypothetical protein
MHARYSDCKKVHKCNTCIQSSFLLLFTLVHRQFKYGIERNVDIMQDLRSLFTEPQLLYCTQRAGVAALIVSYTKYRIWYICIRGKMNSSISEHVCVIQPYEDPYAYILGVKEAQRATLRVYYTSYNVIHV